jgi:tetratricopeptide (TPR) repeat protein
MPGLSQLKKFNSDIIAVGNETRLRASRGEKPISMPVPRFLEDRDDSEDFVLGMPENPDEASENTLSELPSDEDLSDITGTEQRSSQNVPSGNATVPDLTDILHPLESSVASGEEIIPDLSQFADEKNDTETEKEEPSIADLSLDDLLKTTGFDGSTSGDEDTSGQKSETVLPESEENAVPEQEIPGAPPVDFTEPETAPVEKEPVEPETITTNDDFTFAGDEIDMNTNLPEDVAESTVAPVPAPENKNTEPEPSPEDLFSKNDLDLPDFNSDFNFDTEAAPGKSDSADAGVNIPDEPVPGKEAVAPLSVEKEEPLEKFDTSEIEGIDFNIPDTDSQIAAGTEEKTDFELGEGSEFKNENTDFEIPGFSDTNTVPETKSGKIKLPVPDFTGATESGRPPKNTLTDAQYKRFQENLLEYPLNVRVAVEDLIVKNEFTDEAEFEVIEKVLNRVPARQVASHLEKMLDISIPVPRDFERRTASEYEIYKSSFQYQLKNRVVPGIVICSVGILLCIGLFRFTYNQVYKPLKANGLYKQGYVLIEADEYPQSEIKFNEAVKYQLQKNWFYKYAQAYRTHKQYDRAEKMYKNILYCFNYDKPAGIKYAQMECDDLENYEKAEEILKRDVLDNYVNDADGILALGDVYLEWATEKDPSKFEDARIQYASLVQLYGQKDIYLSRMMRYFIRTDNLKEVLELKEHFMPKVKSLEPRDWTELSGYLLDKLFGPLAPSDEYLRTKIEDVKELLVRAVKTDSSNPVSFYNLSRYYIQMKNGDMAKASLEQAIKAFKKAPSRRRRDVYKEIDSYRLLGEEYTRENEYLKAQESYTDGISLYQTEHDSSNFPGNQQVGKLYADIGDIDYFISGDIDGAYRNYNNSVDLQNDNSSIRYRLGYILYSKQDYPGAIGSFIKASEDNPDDNHLLLALGNTLSLNNDNYAAAGYYDRLMDQLDAEREQKGVLFPQVRSDQTELVEMYLKTANNLGVTLYRLAGRTGSSEQNAEAMVQLSQSMRAWDALTRNQNTMIRLGGSNLAEQNMRYMSHPIPDYEPAIYTELPRTLSGEKELAR